MADADEGTTLQTNDASSHSPQDQSLDRSPIKSPVVTEEMPLENTTDNKESTLADLPDSKEYVQTDEDCVPEENNKEDGIYKNMQEHVEKEGRDYSNKDEEPGQGEIADEEDMECNEGTTDEEEESGDEEDDDNETGEGDDEESGDAEFESDAEEEGGEKEKGENSLTEESDMSESEADKCPVCLCPFADQDVGTPESCDHIFCLECILEWAKNVNTCPVDRSLFRAVLVRHCIRGDVIRRQDVDEPKVEAERLEEEDPTYCEVCGRCDREDRLLLCDGCDAGYHCECLDPPLEHIPVEEWFCPECATRNRHQGTRLGHQENTTEVEAAEDSEDEWTTIEQRPNVARAIARTMVSERVRAVISRTRAMRLSNEETSQPSTLTRRPRSLTTPKRKKPARRRKKATKRKRKRKTTKSTKGKKRSNKKKVRRKKTTPIAGVRTVSRTPSTVRSRIAKSLQLVKPRTGSRMPDKKVAAGRSRTMDYRLHEIGAAKLSITGNDGLFYCGADQVEKKNSVPSTSRPVPVVSSSSMPDLLGSIMAGQNILHTKSSDITIHRDGHLTLNKEKEARSSLTKAKELSSDAPKDILSEHLENSHEIHSKTFDGDNPKCETGDDIEPLTQHGNEGDVGNQSPMDQGEDYDSDVVENYDSTAFSPCNVQNISEPRLLPENKPCDAINVESDLKSVANKTPEEYVIEKESVHSIPSCVPIIEEEASDVGLVIDDSFHATKTEHDNVSESEDNIAISSVNPGEAEPDINRPHDSHRKLNDSFDEALLGQEHENDEEYSQTQSESNMCNLSKNVEIPASSLEDGAAENTEDDLYNFNLGADKEIIENLDEKATGETSPGNCDNSVPETIEGARKPKDMTNDGSSVKIEDIELIKVVNKSARTVTRKSIPIDSNNPSETGEIEIIKVDIVNQPKRKDRKKSGGEKSGHASSSNYDSQSEEEGAIPEKRHKKGKDHNKKKKKDSTKHFHKDGVAKVKKTGDSSAEEGEVKSDDERAGGGKKKKKKKKKNKDTRNVMVDSNNPKILIPELSKMLKPQKIKLDGKKSDSESGKSKERGSYGDLRQVIQVKRDSHPDDDARRYESYWNEYGKRRGDERRVESSNQWEQLYSYSSYSFAEGKQWENFTVQRDRSPIYDRRKDKELNSSKRVETRRSSRGGERNTERGRDRHYRQEKETLAEKAVRLEREAARKERQQQESKRGRRLTMAEREARELMKSRMDEHIERKYGKQVFLSEISRAEAEHYKNRNTARDKHGREFIHEHDIRSDRSKDKSRDREKLLRSKEQNHSKDLSRERSRQRRDASRSSRSRDEYSSDRHRSRDKRSYDSDMSRSSSRSVSVPSDKEPESTKVLPKNSTVQKSTPALSGPTPDGEVTKKKKKDKTKGKKDKKEKAAKKAAKKAKAIKAGKKDKVAAPTQLVAVAAAAAAPAKRPAEELANNQVPAKKQKKIKGKKDKKKKKAAKLAKLAAKAGKVPAPRPTCLIQEDDDPDIIDLTGEIENRSPTPSTPPTPKPATPTKPPPKDPSPIVSSTADIRDSALPSSSLYDPFEPTASPPVSYSNSPSPMSSEGGLLTRKGPSSSSMARVSRGSADRDREGNSASKRPYSPRDAPHSRQSPQGSPPRATSSSTTSSIAKLLPALSSQTNSQINQLLGSISNNPALQSVLSVSAGSGHGTSLSGSQLSPSGSEQSYSKVSGLALESPILEERRPTKDMDNIGEVTEEDIESSAVDLYNKNSRERYLKKLHHQERVVEEVKLAIKPHYQRREINKDEYKEILRKSVNQVCHSKSGEINPVKIRNLIEGYVKKALTKRKLGTTMKPLIITSERSRSSSKRGGRGFVLGKLIL